MGDRSKMKKKKIKTMKIKIEEAKRKDINSIVKLNTGLADFHRKLDQYYKPGKETQKGLRSIY